MSLLSTHARACLIAFMSYTTSIFRTNNNSFKINDFGILVIKTIPGHPTELPILRKYKKLSELLLVYHFLKWKLVIYCACYFQAKRQFIETTFFANFRSTCSCNIKHCTIKRDASVKARPASIRLTDAALTMTPLREFVR